MEYKVLSSRAQAEGSRWDYWYIKYVFVKVQPAELSGFRKTTWTHGTLGPQHRHSWRFAHPTRCNRVLLWLTDIKRYKVLIPMPVGPINLLNFVRDS